MFSGSCFELEEFSFFVSILRPINHLQKVAPSLGRSGWLVWWLCKASLRPSSLPIFWHCSRLLHNQDHRPEKSQCLVVVSQSFFCGFSLWAFWHVWPFLWPSVSRSCCDLLLCQSALNPQKNLLVDFRSAKRVTDPWFRHRLISIHVPTIIDGRLLKCMNACLCCDLKCRKINFTNSKTLVGGCRDRPWRSFGLPECEEIFWEKKRKETQANKKKENAKKPK